MTLAEQATLLRSLHRPGNPLVLANVWDAGTAKLVEEAGFAAIATSSVAVSESLGYADHQGAPADEMFAAAARIARVVSLPVTVDAEAGYGLAAAEFVDRLLGAGAVGCNLEDTDHAAGGGLADVGRQAEWLASVRAAADAAGVPLVLNARVDVVIAAGPGAPQAPLVDDVVTRALAYLAAGADCVYPILLREPDAIRAVVAAVAPAAVNVSCPMDPAAVAGMAELGVARVSMGGGPWRTFQQWLTAQLNALAVR